MVSIPEGRRVGLLFAIDPERKGIFCRGRGKVTGEDLRRYAVAVALDERNEPGFAELIDLRGADLSDLSTGEVRAIAQLGVKLYESPKRSKLAIVVDDNRAHDLARAYQSERDPSPRIIRVFRDKRAAVRWLGLGGSSPSLRATT